MNEEIKEILKDIEKGVITGRDKNDIKVGGICYEWQDLKTLLDYITNLQQLEQEHKKINGDLRERIAYLERSNDRREDTILGLRQEINDVEDKNSKLEIALQNIQEDYDRRIKEIDVLKEENKHIFANVNDDELLISNAMNYAEAQDYKSRCEKAIEYINKNKHLSMFADCRESEEDWNYDLECSANDLLNILQNGDNKDD